MCSCDSVGSIRSTASTDDGLHRGPRVEGGGEGLWEAAAELEAAASGSVYGLLFQRSDSFQMYSWQNVLLYSFSSFAEMFSRTDFQTNEYYYMCWLLSLMSIVGIWNGPRPRYGTYEELWFTFTGFFLKMTYVMDISGRAHLYFIFKWLKASNIWRFKWFFFFRYFIIASKWTLSLYFQNFLFFEYHFN